MAYDLFENQDDEDAAKQQQATGQVQLGPETGTQVAGDAKAQNSGTGGGTSSGAYTNLQSYLDANKSLNFGSDVAGQVQKKVDTANQAQSEAETGFKSDVDKATVNSNPDLINQVGTDATQITSSPEKTSDFLRMRNAKYGGPNSLVDEADRYKSVSGATNTAQEQAQATKSEGGRKALLDTIYGSGVGRYDYTPGQKNLDNLLIQNDPNSREAFQSTQQNAVAAGQGLQSLKDTLQGYAGQGKAATQAARAGARGALGIDDAGNVLASGDGAIQKALGGVDQRLSDRQAALASEHSIVDPLTGKTSLSQLTPEQIQRLGVDRNAFAAQDLYPDNTGYNRGQYSQYYQGYKLPADYLYQVDPHNSNYLNVTSDPQLNRSTIANADDLARLTALSQLAGTDQNWISDPSQVGSQISAPLSTYDSARFSGDVAAKRTALNNELSAIKQRYDTAELPDVSIMRKEVNAARAKYGLPPA